MTLVCSSEMMWPPAQSRGGGGECWNRPAESIRRCLREEGLVERGWRRPLGQKAEPIGWGGGGHGCW